jgi:hypothetical protein
VNEYDGEKYWDKTEDEVDLEKQQQQQQQQQQKKKKQRQRATTSSDWFTSTYVENLEPILRSQVTKPVCCKLFET